MTLTSSPSDQQVDRSSTRSRPANMPKATHRTSREWSAAALEADRKAKEEADHASTLKAQIVELQAQALQAEENRKRSEEQSALNKQAARDQEFNEATMVQQKAFRMLMSEEVYMRVAQSLESVNDLPYMTAVAQGKAGFEDPAEFKAMLWEALAGDDLEFLRKVAGGVVKCYNKSITDDDIDMVRNSMACLDSSTIRALQKNGQLIEGMTEEALLDGSQEEAAAQKLEHNIKDNTQAELLSNLDTSHDEGQSSSGPEAKSTTATTIHTEHAPAESDENAKAIKQELEQQISNTQNAMDKIEEEELTERTTRAESITEEEIATVQVPNIVDQSIGEDVSMTIETCETPHKIQHALPATPSSTVSKRSLVEDDGTPTPSEVDTPSSSKRRKTTGTKTNPAVNKLQKYIEARVQAGKFTETDLACSVCENEPEKPRMTAKCHHIYCLKCFNIIKGKVPANVAHKMKCRHQGCETALGAMSIIPEDAIKDLRDKYAQETENNTQESGVVDQCDPGVNAGTDEEVTDEE